MPALPDEFKVLVAAILIGKPGTEMWADTAMKECDDWMAEMCFPEHMVDMHEKGDLHLANRVEYVSSDTQIVFSMCPPTRKTRQNGRKMTSFRGATAKLGACVDNELGGLAPHQCR